ncbi:MAG TPA: cytochrome P450 [Solirubrobacteraceae bacterium]|nr:cytochrome P450 [Solirubrobacteraceae bacterium]
MSTSEAARDVASLPEFPGELLGELGGEPTPLTERLFAAAADTPLRLGADGLVLLRNHDLAAVASNSAAGNAPADSFVSDPVTLRLLENHIFTMNPPVHGPRRSAFLRQFGAGKIERYRGLADAVVEQLIVEGCERGVIDFHREFAVRATVRFWGAIVGLNVGEQATLEECIAGDYSLNFLLAPSEEEASRRAAANQVYLDTVANAIVRSLIAGDEVLLELKSGLDADDTNHGGAEELGLLLAATLTDGFHTLAVGISNAVLAVLARPDVHARLRDSPELIDNAFHEGTRLEPPICATPRYALEDFVYDGLLIPGGTGITMMWMAGNRDPQAFDAPNEYHLDRGAARVRTFGGGLHICAGRAASRLLGTAVLRGLLNDRTEVSAAGGPPRWKTGSFLHELDALPVSICR